MASRQRKVLITRGFLEIKTNRSKLLGSHPREWHPLMTDRPKNEFFTHTQKEEERMKRLLKSLMKRKDAN